MSYLAYRAQFSTGGLSYRGRHTGVIYGVLRNVVTLSRDYNNPNFVFAFDSKRNLRREEFPWYKANRRSMDKETRKIVHDQVNCLRKDIISELGYDNLFMQDGYEGDDIIAAAAKCVPECDSVVMVSADQDLFQCLRSNVTQLVNKELMTTEELKRRYCQIAPHQWRIVKSIAGCKTDNITGVEGVGEITAAKWCRSLLRDGPQKDTIDKFVQSRLYEDNLRIVKLPFSGIETPFLKTVGAPPNWAWDKVLKPFGIKSLEPIVIGDTSVRRGIKRGN